MLVNREKYELSEEHIQNMIAMIINLFIRRNFVLIPKSSNLRSYFNGWRKEIEEENLKGDELLAFLERKINKVAPADEEFIRALKNGIYDVNKQTTRFILIMLQRQNDSKFFNRANRDTLDDYEGKKLLWTIEHILPQGNLPQAWVDDIADGNADLAKELQEKNVHRLGNLTLTPYNSGLGQRTFKEKVNYQDGESPVGFNLPIYLNDSIDTNADKFDVESIDEREQILQQKLMDMVQLTHNYS
ncbi:HNH endonuclease family protein [Fructobacillus sp. CRL 2054]|uniref:HNH endonuclease family protein n=1 Tax=Fructobacillus sp. CRL 2054 TaxID=2763007 RepID=UPI002378036A|nr:HNH endonuclease family protein [Fructobacillus sp. CRL 2054]